MRKNLTIVFLSLTLLLPGVSNAARDYGSNRADAFFGEVYLGVKYGRVTFAEDVPDSDGTDIRNLGFTFGKGINDNIAMEFAYSWTVSDDDTSAGDVSSDVLGLFVVGKTDTPVYVKGRVGYTRLTQERNFAGASFDNNTYGIAWGIGVGVKMGKGGAIEVEYTLLPETEDSGFAGVPVDLEGDYFTVGYVWSFE